MSGFEAQCDCELDSPGVMSDQPIELRLECWQDWALYLKRRIELHYRPALAAAEQRVRELESAGCGGDPYCDCYVAPDRLTAPEPKE